MSDERLIMKASSKSGRWQEARAGLYRLTYDPLAIAGMIMLAAVVIIAIFAPYLTRYANEIGPYTNFAAANKPPSFSHWFGTDDIGKDVFAQVIFGFRISLLVSITVLVASVPIGVILGLLAGYYGGWIESVIQRATDVFLALPALVFALVISAILGPSLKDVIFALVAIWWVWYARIVYSLTRALKSQPYVEAAHVQGASSLRIMLVEILPNTASTLTVKMMLDMGFIILVESGMGFLGIGVQPPTPDLGVMVSTGFPYLGTYWWISLFPCGALAFLILAFNLIGIGLRDLFDVKVV